MIKICITFYHFLSFLITPYHTLSPRLGRKPFYVGNFKISSQAPDFFITSYHVLSLLITSYHTLSPRLERKPFYVGNFKISSHAPDVLSHLITSCHFLSHLITPYHQGWKENHFMLGTLKLVFRLQMFYHILSRLVTSYHTLSHLVP